MRVRTLVKQQSFRVDVVADERSLLAIDVIDEILLRRSLLIGRLVIDRHVSPARRGIVVPADGLAILKQA